MPTARPSSSRTAANCEDLISTEALHSCLGQPGLVILDASWHMPASQRIAKKEYLEQHLPGALFFDIDAICDPNSELPHTLPSAKAFAEAIQELGISTNDKVVVYDSHGLFSAARVWWMFRTFGHDNIAVLDGGLPKWLNESRPVEEGAPTTPHDKSGFQADFQPAMLCSLEAMQQAMHDPNIQIVDVRAPSRFLGLEVEPREGLRSGHIPGSINIHYATLLRKDGSVKTPQQLRTLFKDAGLDLSKQVTATCGSGVTAAILCYTLHLCGNQNWSLYDGSWAEWGRSGELEQACPVASGLPDLTGYAIPPVVSRMEAITTMEMSAPPRKPPPHAPLRMMALLKAEEVDPDFYRYLYRHVGADWQWTDRLLLDNDTLSATLDDPSTELYVLYVKGAPAGFAEIFFHSEEDAEIRYMGILPKYRGQRLGAYLLYATIDIAWRRPIKKLWLTTCQYDHPKAFSLYQQAGFRPTDQERRMGSCFCETA